jgi:hypothetical protein
MTGAIKGMEAAFNKIVDLYTGAPRKTPIDRADELLSQHRGTKR